MKLMYDTDMVDAEVTLTESDTGKKRYIIRGVYSTIGEMNRNKRIYPRNLWEREVEKYQPILSNGSHNSLMEWKHPARSAVDPMEAVAKMEKLYIDGKYVMGESVLLDNEKSNQLKSLIDNKINISVSSRALGSLNPNGTVKDFKLITYDVVPDPSDYNATMSGLVEGFELNEGIVLGLEFDASGRIIDSKSNLNNEQINIVDNYNQLTESEMVVFRQHISEKFKKHFKNYK